MNTDLINALADLQQVIDSMKDEADIAIRVALSQAAPVAAERERKRFEDWFASDALPSEADWFKRESDDPDEYEFVNTHIAWKAWQARTVLPAQAAPVAAEPTLYQYRMRAGWASPARWSEWSNCTALSASDYERMPVMHDYHYEVRRLYLITPQAAPVAAPKGEGS